MQAKLLPWKPELRAADGRRMGEGRSKGVHLSHVLRYIRTKVGDLKEGTNTLFAQFGFMFEMWVEGALARFMSFDRGDLIEPGEVEVEGIWMTPDRFNPFKGKLGAGTVYEFKTTWKTLGGSEKNPPIIVDGEVDVEVLNDRFWYWIVQIQAYCHAMGTREAVLVALFINGDYTYREPFGGPQFVVIKLRFTEEEIEENWALVKRERDAMLREGWAA